MGQTPNLSLPYPELGDSADVPRDIKALADALDTQSVIPAGVIQMWPDAAAPAGWLLCQGQTVPAASNPGLAAIFGTSGGNVTVPDLRGRVLVGTAPVNVPASGDPARALRTNGGLSAVKLKSGESGVPAHNHNQGTIASGSGNNTILFDSASLTNWALPGGSSGRQIGSRGPITANNPVADAAAAHENMPPYYAINYIIRGG